MSAPSTPMLSTFILQLSLAAAAGNRFYPHIVKRLAANTRLAMTATASVWAAVLLASILAALNISTTVTLSILGVLGALCSYILLVVIPSEDEDEAGMRVVWARTLWEHVSAKPVPERTEDEADRDYAMRVFGLAQEEARKRIVDPHEANDFRRALDGMDVAVLAFDEQGIAILANHAASEYFGLKEEQIRARAVEELLPQREAFELVQNAIKGTKGKCSVRASQRIVEIVAAPVQSEAVGSRFAAVVTVRDITDLAQASQLKTDFVASASHEIRTPLAAIKAAAETLRDGAAEMPALRDRFLTMIQNNTERLEELTRDLMDLSRLETPEVEVEKRDLAIEPEFDIIRNMISAALAQRRLKLTVNLDGIRSLHTDPKLLRPILQNLIDNSVKYANEATEIVVKLKPLENGAVRIQVIDEGVGIPLAAQARIFERFYQVDMSRSGQQPRRGTGLGLAIVKHAVNGLGGTISVESVWQQGTTMTVELPGAMRESL